MSSVQWDKSIDVWAETLAQSMVDAVEGILSDLVDKYAPQIESWMKANAPWTDRTANARQALRADTEKLMRQSYEIVLGHGVEYGKWLELANQGRYAIIAPAIDHWTPIILAELRSLLK